MPSHAQGCMHSPPNASSRNQSTMRTSEGSTYSRSNPGPGTHMAMRNGNAPGSMNARPAGASGTGPVNAPPQAAPGECWSSVYSPPEMKTTTERVCLKEPSERFEVTPAEYEWIEEKVCTKEASKQFVVVPAKYETVTETLVLDTGHTDWVQADGNHCRAAGGEGPGGDVFCPVSFPKVEKNVTVERLVQPASMREIEVPAEYQIVRTQRCVKPAMSRRVEIPGEYQTVEKTVEVSPGRWDWQRVKCDNQATAQPLGNPRKDVRKTGYKPEAP